MGRKDSIGQAGFTGLTGFFSPVARGPSAEGRSILLILSNCFSKIRIHSSFFPYFDIHFLKISHGRRFLFD
jgi:hypothetical protein